MTTKTNRCPQRASKRTLPTYRVGLGPSTTPSKIQRAVESSSKPTITACLKPLIFWERELKWNQEASKHNRMWNCQMLMTSPKWTESRASATCLRKVRKQLPITSRDKMLSRKHCSTIISSKTTARETFLQAILASRTILNSLKTKSNLFLNSTTICIRPLQKRILRNSKKTSETIRLGFSR